MKTPEFWFRPVGLAATLLTPFGCVYAALGKVRRKAIKPTACNTPLIVVGNVVAGGAGKTPVTLALAQRLQQGGLKVHCLAKGYGGQTKNPTQVDVNKHTAQEVGDEPLLLATLAPTWIAHDRGAGWLMAGQGADVVISDDGLQNPTLNPTLALLVMNGVLGTGNGKLIPAGPLREPLGEALARVQAIVQVGGVETPSSKPILYADFVLKNSAWLSGAKVIAFAGLAHPEKFFATCTTSGANVLETISFPDHHPFTAQEIQTLITKAQDTGAFLVTTAKDAVRVPPALRASVRVVEGELVWRNVAALDALLTATFPRYKAP